MDLLTAATSATPAAPVAAAAPKRVPAYPPVAGKAIGKASKPAKPPVAMGTRSAKSRDTTSAPEPAEASADAAVHPGLCEQLIPRLIAATKRSAMTAADVLDVAEEALNEYVRRAEARNGGCAVLTALTDAMRAKAIAASHATDYTFGDVAHFIKSQRGERDFELDGNWLRALSWKYTHCIVVLDRHGETVDLIAPEHQPEFWTLKL